jgi:ribosomal protein S18 acetylase RimI-like enzyme
VIIPSRTILLCTIHPFFFINYGMDIQNSRMEDLGEIFDFYAWATEYQKKRFEVHWPSFDEDMVVTEIMEHRQWKMILDGKAACIWCTTFSDPLIWEEKNTDPSVYIHRIATHPEFRGRGLVKGIVDWAKVYASQHKKSFIRMDTVGENLKLIEHYTSYGFKFLGPSTPTDTDGLPLHYHNATVSLFELEV